jgi:hypothetical protein
VVQVYCEMTIYGGGYTFINPLDRRVSTGIVGCGCHIHRHEQLSDGSEPGEWYTVVWHINSASDLRVSKTPPVQCALDMILH